jgi:hypothetical protein
MISRSIHFGVLLGALGFSALNSTAIAGPSTKVFQKGDRQLIVYSDVPGATPSEFYKIRVRSEASNVEWQPAFALITRSLYSQAKIPKKPGSVVSMENYYDHLKDWSHTYANIEMNAPVEIEVSKADGKPIQKAAVHPVAKAGKVTIKDGRAYFSIENPALIAVDIDGQMDDQDTGAGYKGPPIHTVSIFAHPIMKKPAMDDPGVVLVKAGENKNTGWEGGRVFSQRGEGKPGQHKVNVLIRNFRIEDKRSTLQIFQLYSHDDFRGKNTPHAGSSYSGITFQNITAAGKSVNGLPEIFHGCKESPWSGITFDNVFVGGKELTSLDDFAQVNQYVNDITFK